MPTTPGGGGNRFSDRGAGVGVGNGGGRGGGNEWNRGVYHYYTRIEVGSGCVRRSPFLNEINLKFIVEYYGDY